jgi:hypothetical protein
MARNRSMGFSKKGTGTPSRLGGRIARRILNPWGDNMRQGRLAPLTGTTTARNRASGSSRKAQQIDPSRLSMSYPANDPAQWPVIPDPTTGRRGNPSTNTQAKADRNNAAVNHAYLRTTGLS